MCNLRNIILAEDRVQTPRTYPFCSTFKLTEVKGTDLSISVVKCVTKGKRRYTGLLMVTQAIKKSFTSIVMRPGFNVELQEDCLEQEISNHQVLCILTWNREETGLQVCELQQLDTFDD